MKHKFVQLVLIVVVAFVGLTAVAGGVAILTGFLQLPLGLLQGTPFSSYLIPGLVLAIVVGGSGLVAAATLPTGCEMGILASLVAGLILVGWIVVEIAMIGLGSWLQVLYLVLGLTILGLAAYLWTVEVRLSYND